MGRIQDGEQERENVLWKMSISRMCKSGDLEGLIDLRDGPEVLDSEIKEILDEAIHFLERKNEEKTK